ncbi:hypothetical protein ACLB2K_030808 [Fragaria x ananassa]
MGNNSAAMQFLGKIEENGYTPDMVFYNTVIDGLCKATLIDEALKLFAEMISRGITPCVKTYTSSIQGVCDFGRWEQAIRLLNYMVSQMSFQISSPIVSWLIHSVRKGRLWKPKLWLR